MRYLVLMLAIVAACDDAVSPPPETTTAGATAAALRASSSTVKYWNASAQTQQTYGIVRWRFTQAGNGSVQLAGEKANGNDLFAQWLFQSGSPGNPWTVLDSGDTYAAVRQDGNDFYFDPRNEPWSWDWQEAIVQAFVRDAGLILGRKIIHFARLDIPEMAFAGDTTGDCEPAVAQYVASNDALGDAFNDMAGVCLFTGISNLRGAKTCAESILGALAQVRIAMTRFQQVLQYCEDDTQPPVIPPPDPPFEDPDPIKDDPGNGIGSDSQGWSWFTYKDAGGAMPICYQVPGDPAFYCF